MEDLAGVGRIPAVMKCCSKRVSLNGDCVTVTGKTDARSKSRPGLKAGSHRGGRYQSLKATGHIQFPKAIRRRRGRGQDSQGRGERISGPAKVFRFGRGYLRPLKRKAIRKGDVMYPYEGPRAVPAIPKFDAGLRPLWARVSVKTSR